MSKAHPKLANAPLREARFEIKFSEEEKSPAAFDSFFDDVGRNNYKGLIKRHITVNVDLEGDSDTINKNIKQQIAGKSRVLLSNDGHTRFLFDKNLFSYGIRSVYTGWEDFRSTMQNALSKYSDENNNIKYVNLTLWFINAIPWKREEDGNLDTKTLKDLIRGWVIFKELPNSLGHNLIQINSNIMMESEVGVRKIEVAYPAYDDSDAAYIHLKIEVMADFSDPQDSSVEEILEWADIAHSEIHTTFVKSLSSKYYKEIQ